MLLDTITLVLRETLEAGILIAILLSIANIKRFSKRWLWAGLAIGSVLAYVYSINFDGVSEWLDYAGQEVLNASMQITVAVMLMLLVAWLIFKIETLEPAVPFVLAITVVLLLTRELTEMFIFYSGFFQVHEDWVTRLNSGITSGFIGLMIGVSIGVLFHAAIRYWSDRAANRIQITLLSLVAAGLFVQATQLLMQVDWVSSTSAVWDSNWLIQESSIVGQMTYAVFGYEATPTVTEVVGYMGIILCTVAMLILSRFMKDKSEISHAN